MEAVHAGLKRPYGAPRVHADLARCGHHHARERIARLMQAARLQDRGAKL
ncbi:MAG: IS3 family transposase [Streptosporangiaceae bacterium]